MVSYNNNHNDYGIDSYMKCDMPSRETGHDNLRSWLLSGQINCQVLLLILRYDSDLLRCVILKQILLASCHYNLFEGMFIVQIY